MEDIKLDLVAAAGEFIGTISFLFFALGAVQVAGASQGATTESTGTTPQGTATQNLLTYYYISCSFGFSLVANAFVFYRFTGSIFNPSVSLALCIVGAIKPVRFLLVSLGQMLGGIVAAALLDALTPGPLAVGVALGQGASRTQGLFIEAFATASLTIAVLMLAAEKNRLTPLAPLGFGLILFVVMMMSVAFTGGAINTARAFGPAVIEGFPTYHWIYWLGPTLGSLLATAFFYFLKTIKYWQVNPNQDSTDVNHSI